MFEEIVAVIPEGWQYPEVASQMTFEKPYLSTAGYRPMPVSLRSDIKVDNKTVAADSRIQRLMYLRVRKDAFGEKSASLSGPFRTDRADDSLRRMMQVLREWDTPKDGAFRARSSQGMDSYVRSSAEDRPEICSSTCAGK
jgi:hypothetical protein